MRGRLCNRLGSAAGTFLDSPRCIQATHECRSRNLKCAEHVDSLPGFRINRIGQIFGRCSVVTPSVLGERLTLNPLAVLVSIAFWLWLWGPVGAFLGVPILIVATMIFYHVSPVSNSLVAEQRPLEEPAIGHAQPA